MRARKALGGSIDCILCVWRGSRGLQILTAYTYQVVPLKKDLTRAGGEEEFGRLNPPAHQAKYHAATKSLEGECVIQMSAMSAFNVRRLCDQLTGPRLVER